VDGVQFGFPASEMRIATRLSVGEELVDVERTPGAAQVYDEPALLHRCRRGCGAAGAAGTLALAAPRLGAARLAYGSVLCAFDVPREQISAYGVFRPRTPSPVGFCRASVPPCGHGQISMLCGGVGRARRREERMSQLVSAVRFAESPAAQSSGPARVTSYR
jgi:hypothetical protein